MEILSLFSEPEFAPVPKGRKKTITYTSLTSDGGLTVFLNSLRSLASECKLKTFLEACGFDGVKFPNSYYPLSFADEDSLEFHSALHGGRYSLPMNALSINASSKADGVTEFTINALYITNDYKTFCIPVTVCTEDETGSYSGKRMTVKEITVGAPVLRTKVPYNAFFVQDSDEVVQLLSKEKPYLSGWLHSNPAFVPVNYVAAPWLETLCKAGFAIAKKFMTRRIDKFSRDEIDKLNRLCGDGTSPKDIFKTTKAVWKALKADEDISTWDVFRRMVKGDKLTDDSVRVAYERGWRNREFERVNSILSKRYRGKRVFTFESLANYLMRVDMYEAIGDIEALCLLDDYIAMCLQLNMEPRTDGDSLKREHDIAARLIREKKDPALDERIRAMAEAEREAGKGGDAKLALCRYTDGKYVIRPAESYDDLIDEATQQHSCVACYGRRIAESKTRIFFMREAANPGKSLITVEVDPDLTTIRQKAKECNHSIRDKEQTEFLESWIAKLRAA